MILEKDFRYQVEYPDKAVSSRFMPVMWVFIALIVAAVVLLVIGMARAEGFTTEASYYTYKSCIKEGTSGVWTASGEKFNENALTCASRDFKYGTWLKVRNIRNGREVVVKVNDLGPNKRLYRGGRRIDLSAGAFKRIASIKDGVARVTVEEIKET